MDPTAPWPPPDPLGEALHLLRMDGAFYSRAELSALALEALETEEVTVGELAYRLGYRSEAAFARASKRVIGIPPGAVRRERDGRAAA